MKRVTFFLLVFYLVQPGFSQQDVSVLSFSNPRDLAKMSGQLGKPMGSTVTVQGVVTEKSGKGYVDGPVLLVQEINDSLIQETIQVPLVAYFVRLPKFKQGATYRMRVYETGEFVGIPDDAYKEVGIEMQTTGFYFQSKLVVLSAKRASSIKETPDRLLGRLTIVGGTAINEGDTAFIKTPQGKIRLNGVRKWSEREIGKPAEVYGKVEPSDVKNVYSVKDGVARLVRLEDQVGMTVSLRGRAINLNQYWWFNYRGTDIYVEKMNELPGWSGDNHFRPIEITGVLEQAMLPRIDEFVIKSNPEVKLCYIIRNPKWTPVKQLLAFEDDLMQED